VGIITFNRPERLNAINWQMAHDFSVLFDEIYDDEGIKTIILTGSGKGFCAGADIVELMDPDAKHISENMGYEIFNKLENLRKPVIAAINGSCNGGGLELALCCDFRIASEKANFGLGEVKIGVMPAAGGTARLPRLIGVARAKELLYFGNRINSQEAVAIGLVNRVVSHDALLEETRKWANELVERAPLSLQMLKWCVNYGMQMDLPGALQYEARCAATLRKSEDFKEGVSAFVEKRRPDFKGM
jgi:enoyl-CoA hydratase